MTNPVKLTWYEARPASETVTAHCWADPTKFGRDVALSKFKHWLESITDPNQITQVYYQNEMPRNRNPLQGTETCLFIANPDGPPNSREGWDMARPGDWIIWDGRKLTVLGKEDFEAAWQEIDTRAPSDIFTENVKQFEINNDTELTPEILRSMGAHVTQFCEFLARAVERQFAGELPIPPVSQAAPESGDTSPKVVEGPTSWIGSTTSKPRSVGATSKPPIEPCDLIAVHVPHLWHTEGAAMHTLDCPGMGGAEYLARTHTEPGHNVTQLTIRKCASLVPHLGHRFDTVDRNARHCPGRIPDPSAAMQLAGLRRV